MHFNISDMNLSGEDFNFKFHAQAVNELRHTLAIGVINMILGATALFGNAVILITIWKTSSLHSASYMLLSSLAASDLAVGLVVQPPFAIFLLLRTTNRGFHRNVAFFLTLVSLMNITAIAVDRLLALQLHLRYKAIVTTFRVKSVLIFIWVFAAVSAVPLARIRQFIYYMYLPPAIYTCLLVLNFIVYCKIYLIVRYHRRQIQIQHHLHQQQSQADDRNLITGRRLKRSAVNTFLVYILLLVCYLPFSVQLGILFLNLDLRQGSPTVFNVTLTLVFFNSTLNPVFYCWRDRQIRTALKQLLSGLN